MEAQIEIMTLGQLKQRLAELEKTLDRRFDCCWVVGHLVSLVKFNYERERRNTNDWLE